MKQFEEKKDAAKEDEINENEEEKDDGEKADTKDRSPDLNKFIDQISVSKLIGFQLRISLKTV